MDLLKLIAFDAKDLEIVSAHVQDAVAKVGELAFEPRAKRFLVPLHRFAWEIDTGRFRKPHNERRNAVLHFEGVTGVRTAGIDRSKPKDVLELLALTFEPGENPSGIVQLAFSGGGTIHLEVEFLEARLADLGGAWEAISRPKHRI